MGVPAVAPRPDDDVVENGRGVVHGEGRLVACGRHVVLVRGNADTEVRIVVEIEIDVLEQEARPGGAVLRSEADDDFRSGTGDRRAGRASGKDELAFRDRETSQVEGVARVLYVGGRPVIGKDDFVRVLGVGIRSARVEPGRIRGVEGDFKSSRAAFDDLALHQVEIREDDVRLGADRGEVGACARRHAVFRCERLRSRELHDAAALAQLVRREGARRRAFEDAFVHRHRGGEVVRRAERQRRKAGLLEADAFDRAVQGQRTVRRDRQDRVDHEGGVDDVRRIGGDIDARQAGFAGQIERAAGKRVVVPGEGERAGDRVRAERDRRPGGRPRERRQHVRRRRAVVPVRVGSPGAGARPDRGPERRVGPDAGPDRRLAGARIVGRFERAVRSVRKRVLEDRLPERALGSEVEFPVDHEEVLQLVGRRDGRKADAEAAERDRARNGDRRDGGIDGERRVGDDERRERDRRDGAEGERRAVRDGQPRRERHRGVAELHRPAVHDRLRHGVARGRIGQRPAARLAEEAGFAGGVREILRHGDAEGIGVEREAARAERRGGDGLHEVVGPGEGGLRLDRAAVGVEDGRPRAARDLLGAQFAARERHLRPDRRIVGQLDGVLRAGVWCAQVDQTAGLPERARPLRAAGADHEPGAVVRAGRHLEVSGAARFAQVHIRPHHGVRVYPRAARNADRAFAGGAVPGRADADGLIVPRAEAERSAGDLDRSRSLVAEPEGVAVRHCVDDVRPAVDHQPSVRLGIPAVPDAGKLMLPAVQAHFGGCHVGPVVFSHVVVPGDLEEQVRERAVVERHLGAAVHVERLGRRRDERRIPGVDLRAVDGRLRLGGAETDVRAVEVETQVEGSPHVVADFGVGSDVELAVHRPVRILHPPVEVAFVAAPAGDRDFAVVRQRRAVEVGEEHAARAVVVEEAGLSGDVHDRAVRRRERHVAVRDPGRRRRIDDKRAEVEPGAVAHDELGVGFAVLRLDRELGDGRRVRRAVRAVEPRPVGSVRIEQDGSRRCVVVKIPLAEVHRRAGERVVGLRRCRRHREGRRRGGRAGEKGSESCFHPWGPFGVGMVWMVRMVRGAKGGTGAVRGLPAPSEAHPCKKPPQMSTTIGVCRQKWAKQKWRRAPGRLAKGGRCQNVSPFFQAAPSSSPRGRSPVRR